jgi:hypothetical protein
MFREDRIGNSTFLQSLPVVKGKNANRIPARNTGKKLSFAIILFFTFSVSFSQSQRYFARYLEAGTSLTYIRNLDDFDVGQNEFTWNINLAIPLTKRLSSGLQLLNIYTKEPYNPVKKYKIIGGFAQYDFYTSDNLVFSAESSINKGDFCTCGENTRREENLYYLGIGGGFDFPLEKSRKLFLDIAFNYYWILNQIEDKYDYTQYIVGLNYQFE